jgi:hypothetical protein
MTTAGADILHPDRRLIAQLGARPIIATRANRLPTEPTRSAKAADQRQKLVGAAGIEPATYSV